MMAARQGLALPGLEASPPGLRQGVPLERFVEAFTCFAPAGMIQRDDPINMATSSAATSPWYATGRA